MLSQRASAPVGNHRQHQRLLSTSRARQNAVTPAISCCIAWRTHHTAYPTPKGTNTFEQEPNPDGSQTADGCYHPEDDAFPPWFMRTSPNTVSEATQRPSANIGRYTLMRDLNRFPGFRQPATGC